MKAIQTVRDKDNQSEHEFLETKFDNVKTEEIINQANEKTKMYEIKKARYE
jgi:hypothetical protein